MMTSNGPRRPPDRRGALIEALAAHIPADPIEAEHRERMLEFAGASGDICARDRFDPGHFTAGAFVLSPDGGSLLLVFHRRLGRWLQPGGHIDPGDPDFAAAARREVIEETGVEDLEPIAGQPLLFDVDVHPVPPRPGEPAHDHFDCRVLFRARRPAAKPGRDTHATRWVRLATAGGVAGDMSVRRAVAKLVGRDGRAVASADSEET